MVTFERIDITVYIEGDAEVGERAYARLFDKYSELHRRKLELESQQANAMSQARSLSPRGRG